MATAESGISLLARIGNRPNISNINKQIFPSGLQCPHVIEINGQPGSGKSHFCLNLITSVLLPKSFKGICIDGCDAGVIFIDTDQHFNILQLGNFVEQKIRKSLRKVKESIKNECDDKSKIELLLDKSEFISFVKKRKSEQKRQISELVKKILENFIYLKCVDSNQYATTLLSIDSIIMHKTKVSLVIIDSISAFYWHDRIYRADTWHKTEQFYNKIFKVFLNFIKKYKLVLLFTRQDLFNKQNFDKDAKKHCDAETEELSYEFMGKELSNGVNTKINLQLCISSIKKNVRNISCEKDPLNRAVYCVEIADNDTKRCLYVTYHEDGINLFDS